MTRLELPCSFAQGVRKILQNMKPSENWLRERCSQSEQCTDTDDKTLQKPSHERIHSKKHNTRCVLQETVSHWTRIRLLGCCFLFFLLCLHVEGGAASSVDDEFLQVRTETFMCVKSYGLKTNAYISLRG